MAFIMRHLPKLKENVINVGDCCECLKFNAIQLLHQLNHTTNLVEGELRRFQTTGNLDDNTESLDVKYMFNAPFSGILTLRYYFVSMMLTFLNVFSGNLFLTELGGVTIQSRCGIEAAISLCPQLQGISFVSNVNTASDDLLTTEELKSILTTRWPKVKICICL